MKNIERLKKKVRWNLLFSFTWSNNLWFLRLAAFDGNLGDVKLYLKKLKEELGNQNDCNNKMILYMKESISYAAMNGHTSIVNELISQLNEPQIKVDVIDVLKDAICKAVYCNRHHIGFILDNLIKNYTTLHPTDEDHATKVFANHLILTAIDADNTEAFEYLINADCKINHDLTLKADDGQPYLIKALTMAIDNGNKNILKSLFEGNIDDSRKSLLIKLIKKYNSSEGRTKSLIETAIVALVSQEDPNDMNALDALLTADMHRYHYCCILKRLITFPALIITFLRHGTLPEDLSKRQEDIQAFKSADQRPVGG